MICPTCGTPNKENARFCIKCGQELDYNSKDYSKNKIILLVSALLILGLISSVVGYAFLGDKSNPSQKVNETLSQGTPLEYSSEYVSFDKAKSIAVSNSAKGVSTSDPILIKDKQGRAVYICTYSYDGDVIGGIIINAKNGAVIYHELNLPFYYNVAPSTEYKESNYNEAPSEDLFKSDPSYDSNENSYDDSENSYSDSEESQPEKCSVCKGSGWVAASCNQKDHDINHERDSCPNCDYNGWNFCSNCDGDGYIND
jgi:uncharacterized membrane protein YkoI